MLCVFCIKYYIDLCSMLNYVKIGQLHIKITIIFEYSFRNGPSLIIVYSLILFLK